MFDPLHWIEGGFIAVIDRAVMRVCNGVACQRFQPEKSRFFLHLSIPGRSREPPHFMEAANFSPRLRRDTGCQDNQEAMLVGIEMLERLLHNKILHGLAIDGRRCERQIAERTCVEFCWNCMKKALLRNFFL